MLSRFHRIPERRPNGQTDRQTDLLYQYRVSVRVTRDKNRKQNVGGARSILRPVKIRVFHSQVHNQSTRVRLVN